MISNSCCDNGASVVDNTGKVTLPEDDASDTTETDIDDLREDVTDVIAEPFMPLNNNNTVVKYNQSDNDSSSHTPERKSNLGESSSSPPIRITSSLSSVSLSASAKEFVPFNPAITVSRSCPIIYTQKNNSPPKKIEIIAASNFR